MTEKTIEQKIHEQEQENIKAQFVREGILRVIQAAQEKLALVNEVLNNTSAEVIRLKKEQEKPAEIPEIMPDKPKNESNQQM